MRRHPRLPAFAGLLFVLVLLAAACAGGDPLAEGEDPTETDGGESDGDSEGDGGSEADAEGDGGSDDGAVTVGSANFPESVLLAEMFALALSDAGLDVDTRLNIGAREVYFPALTQGEIDVLPEYAGALLAFVSDDEVTETETEPLVERLRDEIDDAATVLDPSEAENRNSLVVTPETAEEYDLETVSDLAPVGDELVLGGPPEYRERRVGVPGLEEVYGITFAEFRSLDPGGPLTIGALEDGDIDVAALFTTQGVIDERDWVVLTEDQPLVPAENIVPVVRDEALTDEVEQTLGAIADALTTEELTQLNRRVEIDNDDPDVVAEEWLDEQGLVEG